MKSLAFSQFQHLNMTTIGLFIFLGFFIGVVVWTSLKTNKDIYKVVQNFPLDGNDK